jgi:hypothetical protein
MMISELELYLAWVQREQKAAAKDAAHFTQMYRFSRICNPGEMGAEISSTLRLYFTEFAVTLVYVRPLLHVCRCAAVKCS